MFFSFEADTCYEESSSAFQIRPAVQDFRDQESSRWKHVFFRLRMLDDAASSCTEQESKDACNVLQPCFCSAESWDEMSEPCGCRVKHEAMTGNVNRDGRPGFLLHLTNRNTTQHHSTSLDITQAFSWLHITNSKGAAYDGGLATARAIKQRLTPCPCTDSSL